MKNIKPINKKLSSLILVIIITVSILFAVFLGIMIYSDSQYNTMLNNLFEYTRLSQEINNAYINFDNYIQSQSENSLESYYDSIYASITSAESIKNNASSKDIYYHSIGINELILSYKNENQYILDNFNKMDFDDIYPNIKNSQTYYTYIVSKLSQITKMQTEVSLQYFDYISSTMRVFILVCVLFMGVLLFSILMMTTKFSKTISKPITTLTSYAVKISKGQFTEPDIYSDNFTEIHDLSQSLNSMKHKINHMIIDLKDKSMLEAQLRESVLENLNISNHLKSTQLKILQAQINPHFLFNTLNSISRLAYIDNNDKIVKLIEALSDMLRYNLNKIDRPITLNEEINNLNNYIYIQKVRYTNKLDIDIILESDHLDIDVPCLILQPLVENSIMHGLKPLDYCGEIIIKIYDEDNITYVSISDNGVGIPEETVKEMNNILEYENNHASTGIGYGNVASRLYAHLKYEDCITISSSEGEGTNIIIKFIRQD